MAYTKTAWQDSPSTATPINATNLNHIEGGIYDAHTGIATLDTTKATKQEVSQLNNDLTISSTSTSTTISDSADGYIRDFEAYGKSEQGENPTPEHPQEIKSWDGDVRTRGKNRLNLSLGTADSSSVTCHNDVITFTNSNYEAWRVTPQLNDGDVCTVSFDVELESGGAFTAGCGLSNKMINASGHYNYTFTYNLNDSSGNKVVFCGTSATSSGKFKNIQIELGTTATTYAPYHSTLAELGISLYGVKVSSGGNYTDSDGQHWIADKLDLRKGVIERYIGKERLTSALNGEYGSVNGYFKNGFGANKIKYENVFLSNYFLRKETFFAESDGIWLDDNLIITNSSLEATTEAYNTWLDSHEVYLAYTLKTPTTENLTSAQISALRNLQTYSDGTYIEYGTLQPFATIDYFTDTDNGKAVAEVDSKASGNTIKKKLYEVNFNASGDIGIDLPSDCTLPISCYIYNGWGSVTLFEYDSNTWGFHSVELKDTTQKVYLIYV